MDMNELLRIGAKVFQQSDLSGQAGSSVDLNSLQSALAGLTGGGSGFDFAELIGQLNSGGLSEIAGSWLGDGANKAISPEQVDSALGHQKITEFASRLGLSEQEAAGGLADALPQMVDKASSGGSILESLGGLEGVIGLAGKLFK